MQLIPSVISKQGIEQKETKFSNQISDIRNGLAEYYKIQKEDCLLVMGSLLIGCITAFDAEVIYDRNRYYESDANKILISGLGY